MRIHRQIGCGSAAESGIRRAILQEISSHPMVLTRTREIFHRFSKVPAMQFRAAFARRPDQHQREAGIERHGHKRCLAIA